jgi:hypothetical protein
MMGRWRKGPWLIRDKRLVSPHVASFRFPDAEPQRFYHTTQGAA